MQENKTGISLKQWFTEHKNSVATQILSVLMNKAAQQPLFPCCSGLFLRLHLHMEKNEGQRIAAVLHELEQEGVVISHHEEGTNQYWWRINPIKP